MECDEKIKHLEEKIKELEQLKEYRFLTNDIKNSLAHYIQSNEEFKKEIIGIVTEGKDSNQKNLTNILIEYKWIFLFIVIAIIIAFKVK